MNARSRTGRHLPRAPVGKVRAAAFVLSAGVHVVLLLGLRFTAPAGQSVDPFDVASTRSDVMRAIQIRPVSADVQTMRETDVVRARAATPPEPAGPLPEPVRPGSVEAGGAGASSPTTVAERFAPAPGDPRLWQRRREALVPSLEPLDAVNARAGRPMAAYNDSVAAAVEAARSAANWTSTRSNGERWGFSPDTIHLGNTRRVLRQCSAGPCPGYLFQPMPGRRDEQTGLLRVFEETRLQVRRAEVDRAFQDHVRALRAQNDSVRAVRRGGGR